MTRNEHILLIMTWARSYHGLSLEDCKQIAETVLDLDFGGTISDADPVEVMAAFDKNYFELNSKGSIIAGDHNTPLWEDYGVVRPPEYVDDVGVSLSDRTFVNASSLAIGEGEGFVLELNSGGSVPVLTEEVRAVVYPTIFSDPRGHDQNSIDALVQNPPSEFVPSNYVEEQALACYEKLVVRVNEIQQEIANHNANQNHSHNA